MMSAWLGSILSRVHGLFGQGRADRELNDEIETHVDLLAERFVSRGMSRTEAVLAARRQFGNDTLLRQRHRETRTFSWPATIWQDIRFAVRVLAKRPGITAISVISLALGIGANTAIFTLAKAALFDALSVPHPEQLRLLAYAQDDRSAIRHSWGDFYTDSQGRTIVASFSWPVYQQLLRKDHSLGELFAFVDLTQFEHLSATIDGHAEVVSAELVSGNFFQGIGVGVALGRPILPGDDAVPGSGAVAVISDSFWARHFARSPSVIGKTIDVNLTPVTIIGVAPHGFTGASSAQRSQDLFIPLSMQPVIFPQKKSSLLTDRETWWIQVMGRLQPNTSVEQARTSLAVSLHQAIQSTMAVEKDQTIPPLLLLPGGRGWNYAAQELEHPMPLLLSLAGLVLLLACVNVASVLLAQSSSRSREISVRMALGARKLRVARQMLTESLCLSLMGGAGGLLLGYLGRGVLPRLFSSSWGPVALQTRFDWRVFAFTVAISVLTGIGFGVGPSWQAAHSGVNQGLKDGGTTASRRRKGLAGKGLIVVQVALCTLLLVSAGLFVRTFTSLTQLDPGFKKTELLLFTLEPPQRRYPSPKDAEVLHRIEERLAALPGVVSATLSKEALLAQSGSNSDFIPVGRPLDPSRQRYIAFNAVGQSFFKTMGISILNGRQFDDHDTSTSPAVAVINRALAQREFPEKNPIGSSFRMKEGGLPIEIVGVCADSKYAWIRQEDPPAFFVLYTQQKDVSGGMTFEIRTNGNPRDFVAAIRASVESIDKDLPLIDIRTQQEQIDATLASERSFASVTTGFGVLALLLASIGIYGVMAAAVSRRVNEIGVRMALGAQANQVLRMVLGEATMLALAGVCVGLLAAFELTRFLASFLYGIEPTDALTFAASGILLWLVAIVASWSPARRASSIQPVQALRHE
jgi:predicted permease